MSATRRSPTGDLRDEIATKESAFYRILSSTDTYDPDRLTGDKENLRKFFYLSEGYADFRVLSAVAELSPDQEAFFTPVQWRRASATSSARSTVKTTLKDLDPKTLQGDITTKEGDWYDASKVTTPSRRSAITSAISAMPSWT